MKIIIVGGVATGASCAARLRRLNEEAEIIMVEKGEHISFANCGLPYHISGVIEDREDLILQTPQDFKNRFLVDVRVLSEAIAIDIKKQTITIRNNATGKTTIETYDKAVLAMGSEPFVPPMEGKDLPGVFTLRSIKDMDQIIDYIATHQVKRVALIGGGAIGIEVAENLVHLQLATTIIELADHVIAPLDKDMAMQVHQELRNHGINLRLSTALTSIKQQNGHLLLALEGEEMETDMVILSIGVRPDTKLAKEAGLELSPRGAILVNDKLQTSNSNIYAGGDAIAVIDFVSGALSSIPLAGPANKHGRIIADQLCGIDSQYKKTQGTAILKAFDLTVAMCGINEQTAKRTNIPYQKLYLAPNSHASYFPGATPISIKVLFEPESGRLLGAQMIGLAGVDKRMDVFATAMRANLSIVDLKDLELCYSPVYSSAKDPINMIGFVGENILEGKVKQFFVEEITSLNSATSSLLDVRTKEEFDAGHLPHAKHLDVNELRSALDSLDRSNPIYVYCQVGIRGYLASRILSQAGFEVYNLSGGYYFYQLVYSQ